MLFLVDFQADWSLALSTTSEPLSVFLYGYENLDIIVIHFATFVLLQNKAETFYPQDILPFSTPESHFRMNESSRMLTQADWPFLYSSQEGLLRLNSSFRLYVGNGNDLSLLLNPLICDIHCVFCNICTFLSFYHNQFVSGISFKIQSQILTPLYISLLFW